MKLTQTHLISILIAVVVLLAFGQLYMLMRLQSLSPAASEPSLSGAMPAANAASSTEVASAPAPSNILVPISGVVASVSGAAISIAQGSSTISVAIDPSAVLVREGNLKDSDVQEADLEKFHAYSEQLAQDPVKNKEALETLIAPSPSIETQISLSDITAGESVTAYTLVKGGQRHAVRVEIGAPTADAAGK